MKESAFEVVGGKTVGEKASLMMEHEALVHEVGLCMPKTTVIASEVIKPTMDNPTGPLDGLSEVNRTVTGRFSGNEFLVVRSSSEGDGRGNGIYESAFAFNDEAAVTQAVAKVLRSFHEPHAKDFRRQIEAGDDFALMIQPLVGRWLRDDESDQQVFGPPLSGYGYSRTRFDEQGVINIVGGMGGGVDRDGGEQITPHSIEIASQHYVHESYKPMSMIDYIEAIRTAERYGTIDRVHTDFRDQRPLVANEELRYLKALVFAEDDGLWQRDTIDLGLTDYDFNQGRNIVEIDSAMGMAVKAFEPHKLLETIQRMEEIAGYPLYVEWATEPRESALDTYIVQIAPVDASPRSQLEAKLPQEMYVVGDNLIGHGEYQSKKIVICNNPHDVEALRDFNSDPSNEGYILLFSAHITSGAQRFISNLSFADFSNANVVVELGSSLHDIRRPQDHIIGAFDMTGKIFASSNSKLSNYFEDLYIAVEKEGNTILDNRTGSIGRITVLEGDFKVVADETQDRVFIGR